MSAEQQKISRIAAKPPTFPVEWVPDPERTFIMLVAILGFLRAWKRYNASLNELYQLGDRELADIGITRSDIPRIAWDNAHR